MWWPFKKPSPPSPPAPELLALRGDVLKSFYTRLDAEEGKWPFMAAIGFSDTPKPVLLAKESPYTYKRWWDRDNAPRLPSFDEERFKRWHFTQILLSVNPTTGRYDLCVTLEPSTTRVREGHARKSLLCLEQSFDTLAALAAALAERQPKLDPQTHEMLSLFRAALDLFLASPGGACPLSTPAWPSWAA
jgi:hypothetical protein